MTPDRASVSIVGGSGYVGGELIRLLAFHPHVALRQVTSASQTGHYLHAVHPNLRGVSEITFSDPAALEPCDLVFLALPQGEGAGQSERAVAALKLLAAPSARVMRAGEIHTLAAAALVPGDIVRVEAGHVVTAAFLILDLYGHRTFAKPPARDEPVDIGVVHNKPLVQVYAISLHQRF